MLVYSLVSIYLSFDQLYAMATYTSLLASFHLLVMSSILHQHQDQSIPNQLLCIYRGLIVYTIYILTIIPPQVR